MIKLTATALIHSISPVIEIPSKTGGNPFQKRELILDDSYTDRDGTPRPNFVSIEFTGERMAILDQYAPGMKVSVEACVNGRESNGRIFNSIRGLSVQPYQPAQAYPQQPAPGYAQQLFPQQPAYPQQQAYPQQNYPQQAPAQSGHVQHAAPGGYPRQGSQQTATQRWPQSQPQSPGVADLPWNT